MSKNISQKPGGSTLGIQKVEPQRGLKPCLICMFVSGLWLLLSLGIVLGYLDLPVWQIPIAILMGTSVMGIAGQGEKRFAWAAENQKKWKGIVLLIGVPLAYLAVTHLSLITVLLELAVLIVLAAILFRMPATATGEEIDGLDQLKKKLKICC